MKCLMAMMACLFVLPAAAGQCKGVPYEGHCQSQTTVEWCENGEKKSLKCQGGQVCAWNEKVAVFDCVGGKCIADIDALGEVAVPEAGMCGEDDTVVYWCEDGHVKSLACGMGTTCRKNNTLGLHDCLPISEASAEMGLSDPEPGDEPRETDRPPPPKRYESGQPSGGVPPISYDDEPTAQADTAQSEGCTAAAGGRAPWAPFLSFVVLLGIGRFSRRRSA